MRRLCTSTNLAAVVAACWLVGAGWASEHHGTVNSVGLPLPGATVTAIQGDKRIVTTTDDQGRYAFADLPDGIWTIQVEMFGFEKVAREVGISPGAPSPDWQLRIAPLNAAKQNLPAAEPEPARRPRSPVAGADAPASGPAGHQRGGPAGPGNRAPAVLRQALAQNGFQQANVNAATDLANQAEETSSGSAGNETPFADLNQSASDSFVVNGSVSAGLNLPRQNDWFGFGRGFDNGFLPGGPGGFGPAGSFLGPDNPGVPGAGGGAGAAPAGGPGPGGGPGGRGPGGFGGAFGGGRGGGRGGRGGFDRGRGPGNVNAFGNGRRNRRQQYNGNVALILDNSALDARPYSLTGQDTPKAAYDKFRTTGMFGGPLKIPHLVSGQNTFFTINYQLTRGRNANISSALVPTADQRAGVVNPQAQALLQFYPLPNFAGNRYNYQVPLVSVTNQNNVNARLSHTINSKNQVSGNFAWQSSNATNPNLFGFVDATTMTGYNTGLQYTYHFTTRLISNLRYNFSRQATDALPFFAYTSNNVSGNAGIHGNDQAPAFYGPPTVMFSNGIATLSDGNLARNHNTTNQVGESLLWVRGSHNFTFGTDFRRLDFNQFSQQNPRGTLLFAGTGSDFANFQQGLWATSSIAFGNPDKYFRTSWIDAFVNDDWRLNSKLSINAGLRWDFQAPVTELQNRLVNLAVSPNFMSATPVCGTTTAEGCPLASQLGYPSSLVRPNYHDFQPRIGVAWRPFKASTVVRAGYGLYYNTSVYQALAAQMAQQAPISYSVTQSNPGQNLLDNPFPAPVVPLPTFALDPNFQIGYLHYWQFSVQQNLPASMVATVTYNGNKGTHQVQEFLPNTFPAGAPQSPYPAGYAYLTSGGNSNYNAVSGQLQRRFRSGLAGNIVYTFSKAIDDAQSLGGRGAAASQYAQNWLDLNAERSLSSFNRTHTLNMNMQWSTGQGVRGGTLLSGWKGALAKDWTFSTAITVGSGLPETPIALNRIPVGTGFNGTVRAEYLGGSLAPTAPGEGFNAAAFGPAPTGQWGNAGRNIITGPMQFTLNASAGRVFRIADRRSIDLRFDSTNLLNHVSFTSWNTTLGQTFGLPAGAGAMRTMQATLRFRF